MRHLRSADTGTPFVPRMTTHWGWGVLQSPAHTYLHWPMELYARWGWTWRHLSNTIELYVLGCDCRLVLPFFSQLVININCWKMVISCFKLTTVGRWAFVVVAPHVWNNLPTDIIATNYCQLFVGCLKKCFFLYIFWQSYPNIVCWHYPSVVLAVAVPVRPLKKLIDWFIYLFIHSFFHSYILC